MWPFTMSKKNETTAKNLGGDKETASEEKYPVKIVVPEVATLLGSDRGVFMRKLSEHEAEIFVNGEAKVVGVETFVKDEEAEE